MSDSLCNGGAPAMNTDISGIGVRISFYLQALFLACLSVRSCSLEEVTSALYTLVATNMAMAVTSLILGFKTDREMSFQDALVVFYLLAISWVAVFFSLPSYNRFPKSNKRLKVISIFQSYFLFAFSLALLIKAKDFGSNPECNGNAVVVLFRPFSALKAGRIIGWIVVVAVIIIYTVLTYHDHVNGIKADDGATAEIPGSEAQRGPDSRERHRKARSRDHIHGRKQVYNPDISGDLLLRLLVILVLWALAVMNTELLIRWNHFEHDGGSPAWQFGQILPMFLAVLPLINLVNAFRDNKLHPRQHHKNFETDEKASGSREHSPSRLDAGDEPGRDPGGTHIPFSFGPGSRSTFPFGPAPPTGSSSPFAPDGHPMDFLSSILGGPSSFRRSRPIGSNPRAHISEHSIHDEHNEHAQYVSNRGRIEEIQEIPVAHSRSKRSRRL